jgi:hypothetical protein
MWCGISCSGRASNSALQKDSSNITHIEIKLRLILINGADVRQNKDLSINPKL